MAVAANVSRLALASLATGLTLAAASLASAQTFDLPPAPPGYRPFVPDIPESTYESTTLRESWFTLKVGAVPIIDYTWFSQDDASVEQVGVQEDEFDWRSARVTMRGDLFHRSSHPWSYLFNFEWRGFDTDPDNDWSIPDLAVTAPVGALGRLTVGKTKESFVYEMVGDAANLPHMERLLNPFFISRNIGLRLGNTFAEQRGTYAVGAFNDWITSDLGYDETGWDVSARVTGLARWEDEGRSFLHLGAAWRYTEADAGTLRYRGRAESNVSDYFVDTKTIPASHANHLAAEALWNEGPVSVLAEATTALVDANDGTGPRFSGWYVTASWVVTGEHRPYDRVAGYARRVVPGKRWGALELIGRYGVIDLTDAGIDGGDMKAWFAAANWWATRRWRISLGYGANDLEKIGLEGHTEQVHARMQWVY